MKLIISLLKTILALFIILSVSIIGLIICLFRPFHKDNTYIIGRLLAKTAPLLGIKVEPEGELNFDGNNPCIIVSNHQNMFDLFILSQVLPKSTVTLGKKELKWIPIFGQFFCLSGNILIDRANRTRAIETMNQMSRHIHETGKSVWIMPEGTRSRGRGVLPFKKGAFQTAIRAGLPVVCVCAESYHKCLNIGKLFSGTVKLKVLEAISTKDLTVADVGELRDRCEALVRTTVDELDQA